MNVLLVEDDLTGLAVSQMLLKKMGYTVSIAVTGEDGEAAFREERPDVVVLDLGLPDVDGLELLKSFKARRPDCPVIVLSGKLNVPAEVEERAESVLIKGMGGAERLLEAIVRATQPDAPAGTLAAPAASRR